MLVRFQPRFLFLVFALVLQACGGPGGEVDYKYQGISADRAADLLNNAKSAGEHQETIAKVAKDPRYGFDWPVFWTGLAAGKAFERMNEDNRKALLSLQSASCSKAGFAAYAQYVSSYPAYISFLSSPKRSCAIAIPEEIFALVQAEFRRQTRAAEAASYLEKARTELEFLIQERGLAASKDWASIFNSVPAREWERMGRAFLEAKQSQELEKLFTLHQTVLGHAEFGNKLLQPLLSDAAAFRAAISGMGMAETLRLFAYSSLPANTPALRNASVWTENLTTIADAFSKVSVSGSSRDFVWQRLWTDYLSVRDFERRFAPPVPLAQKLAWLEKLQRKVEKDLNDASAASAFLAQQNDSLDVAWFQFRLGRQKRPVDKINLAALPVNGSLDESLLQRLTIRAAETKIEARERMLQFCAFLRDRGVPERHFHSADSKAAVLTLAEPGCARSSEEGVIRIQADAFTMAFDSVLLTGGASVEISAKTIDASALDLSATRTHPDLPSEPTPASADALALPLLIGLRITDPDLLLNGAGIYYFLFHYIARSAEAGAPAVAQPQPGFAAGDAKLSAADAAFSYLPTIVSFGGPAQKSAPARAGGKASVSDFPWNKAEMEMRLSAGEERGEARKAIPLPKPSLLTLRLLIANAERNAENEKIHLYFDDKSFSAWISPAERSKMESLCPAGLEFRACVDTILPSAAAQLEAEMEKAAAAPEETVLPQLQGFQFTAPAGALGPENPSALSGPDGTVEFKGFTSQEHEEDLW